MEEEDAELGLGGPGEDADSGLDQGDLFAEDDDDDPKSKAEYSVPSSPKIPIVQEESESNHRSDGFEIRDSRGLEGKKKGAHVTKASESGDELESKLDDSKGVREEPGNGNLDDQRSRNRRKGRRRLGSPDILVEDRPTEQLQGADTTPNATGNC